VHGSLCGAQAITCPRPHGLSVRIDLIASGGLPNAKEPHVRHITYDLIDSRHVTTLITLTILRSKACPSGGGSPSCRGEREEPGCENRRPRRRCCGGRLWPSGCPAGGRRVRAWSRCLEPGPSSCREERRCTCWSDPGPTTESRSVESRRDPPGRSR